MGPVLGAAGPCPTVTHNGKTWQIGHPTQNAKATLEILVVEAAQRNIDKLKSSLSVARYEAKCAALDTKIEGGHHRTWGSLWRSVNSGPDGTALFLLSLLREKHPEATFEDAEALLRDEPRGTGRAFMQVAPAFFSLLVACLPGATPQEKEKQMESLRADFARELASLTHSESTA